MEQLYEFNLRDYWTIFLKRKWEILISFLVVFFSIFIYTSLQVPLYQAIVLVKVDPALVVPSEIVFPTRSYYVSRESELSDATKQIVSRPVLEMAVQELGWIKEDASPKEKDKIISGISSGLSAVEIEKSNIIKLSLQSEDQNKVAQLANKIAEVFKRVNAEQKNARTRNVRVFIEKALNDISGKLKEQEERLSSLTTQGAVGLGVEVVNRLTDSERRLADYLNRYTEKHPQIIALRENVNRLRTELNNLPKEEFEYGILKRDIAINQNLYTSLKQQLQEAQIKEAEKIDNVIIVNPAIMPKEPFYPNKKRNYLVGVVLGLSLGVAMALLSENLDTSIGRVDDIESFIKVNVIGVIPFYKAESKKEEKISSKKAGRWFFKKSKPQDLTEPLSILELERSHSNSLFLEAFRLLAVNLQVLFGKGAKIKNKIIMVTSCKPEEGKTLITSTLSVIMAQMGHNVLVIDGDVRRAHIHKSFCLKDKENGLLDVLSGKLSPEAAVKTATDIMLGSADIDKIIDKPWLNNINILTSGSSVPNMINLFNSNKFVEAMEYWRNKYDLVLIDSSPILAVSEPSLFLPQVDGAILAYRAGATSRIALRRAKIHIEGIKGKGALSGVVLNYVTPEIGVDTYYYYSKRYYGEKKKSGEIKPGEDKQNVS